MSAPVGAPRPLDTVRTPRTEPVRSATSDPGAADFRLVIQEDAASGAFVYVTLDRRTGEVVNQVPSEDLLRLRDRPDYAAGRVVSTKA